MKFCEIIVFLNEQFDFLQNQNASTNLRLFFKNLTEFFLCKKVMNIIKKRQQ